jgi:hypothetical protein
MRKVTKATVVMDSGKELNFDESSTKELLEMLVKNPKVEQEEPYIINNKHGVTTAVIYPKHISHIHFE